MEAEFEKLGNEKPMQTRFLRSQQDLKAKMEAKMAAGPDAEEGYLFFLVFFILVGVFGEFSRFPVSRVEQLSQ